MNAQIGLTWIRRIWVRISVVDKTIALFSSSAKLGAGISTSYQIEYEIENVHYAVSRRFWKTLCHRPSCFSCRFFDNINQNAEKNKDNRKESASQLSKTWKNLLEKKLEFQCTKKNYVTWDTMCPWNRYVLTFLHFFFYKNDT